ncbi:MAG: phospholipase D-like domain-containing protein [Acidobacteriota bacterium]|nr:phospholipase D-like domain-containing protein [Acidobacteriota bacterium]
MTRPKGLTTLWTRVRRLLWSWWLWAAYTVYLINISEWWAAFGVGLWAGVCSLATPMESAPQYGLDHGLEVGSQEFIDTMEGAAGVPLLPGNKLELLNNGDSFYPAMLKAVREAERSITIEAYIYWAGEIGMTFAHALAERASKGVKVKVMLDAVGSASIGDDILKILKAGGAHVAWYNPIRWNKLRRINNRTHRKSLIVDGYIGFTGGAGIADQWTGNAQDKKHWRDLQVRVEGPAVRPLQTGFAQNWLECTGELVTGPDFYPHSKAVGRLAVQTIMSSPETGASTARVMYVLAISAARHSIEIANPYFVPDHLSIDLFRDAVKRGVRVRVMVAGTPNDTFMARLNSLRLYGALLEAGVELSEYNRTLLHHKTMVVDGLWATVGTTNFDNRSFSHNEENNVCVCDAQIARELNDMFAKDALLCDRVDLETWRRRPFLGKVAEALASFVQDQV